MTKDEAINICKREQYCASHSTCPLEECPWNGNCPDDAPFDSEIQEAFQMAIEALSAERKGKWIVKYDDKQTECSECIHYDPMIYECSECHHDQHMQTNYCSNCGVLMEVTICQ